MNYSIGIDIGGTNTCFGLVNENAEIIFQREIKTKNFPEIEDYLTELVKQIKDLISHCPEPENILGVGIGAPNGNYYKGTIELAPNLPFKGIIPIKNMLEMLLLNEGWNLKVTITNDANAAGIGEMIYGAAKGVNDFIMITLGTGVGSAIVSNGEMIYGHDGFAGEVGHTIVEIDGRECGCGRKGCLETYSSATGIRRTALSLLKQENSPSILREIEEKDINGYTICEAARKNDALALKCIDFTARMLAIGVANAVAVTSPKKIIFSGGLSKAGDLLLTPFKAYLEENLYPVFRGKIEVELSALEENNTAILGAAALNY
ncbi:MAG: ROK family protein [Bacteroidales bacterium]|jgi:glucokinase|nr:ROK family protein [Bacteroidales bacterium]